MNKIRILQYGAGDWRQTYRIPENVELTWFAESREQLDGIYDLLLVDGDVADEDLPVLLKSSRAHCVYLTEQVKLTGASQELFERKAALRLYTGDVQTFLEQEARWYFGYSYGEKFNRKYLVVNQGFGGEVTYNGGYDLCMTGDFGDDWRQLAYWKNNIPIYRDQCIDFFLEYETAEEAEIKLVIHQIHGGGGEPWKIWEFSGEELKDVVRIESHAPGNYILIFASIHARGTGTVRIHSLHDRHSRRQFGYFLPGGDRFVTSKGEELFCYFDPGDRKPPLSVYFSGWRNREGFEGYYMMRKLGCPVLLVTDPRLEGGAFYIGGAEYEEMVKKALEGYIRRLGFTREQVILSGISMGTFGSLYYGCDIRPHALILGKPLPNLGDVAANETLERIGVFPTSLDVLRENCGNISGESVRRLNEHFWKKFDATNWRGTKFIVSYLYEDDYDPNGYRNLLEHLRSGGVAVYGKGTHGHHNDNTAIVTQWFKSQYAKVLREDYGRTNV